MHSAKAAVLRFGKFSLSSLSSSMVDLAAFALLCEALRPALPEAAAIVAATVAARVLSCCATTLSTIFWYFRATPPTGVPPACTP